MNDTLLRPVLSRLPRLLAVFLLAGPFLIGMATSLRAVGDPGRGRDLFALAGGCGCHTSDDGVLGGGGRELKTPLGTFYGTNITPDRETGLGDWSEEEIVTAIRRGDARGKGVEAPVMPYYQYSGMSDQDVSDLVAYLRTLPPVRRENRPAEVVVPLARVAYRAWRWWFVAEITPMAEAPPSGPARGQYLADHVSICGDCHTPRTILGVPQQSRYLAGTASGPDGRSVPNITADADEGIGSWDADDVMQVLQLGMLPDFDNVQGLMAEVVDGYAGGPGYARARASDLRAIAEYLKTVPSQRSEGEHE